MSEVKGRGVRALGAWVALGALGCGSGGGPPTGASGGAVEGGAVTATAPGSPAPSASAGATQPVVAPSASAPPVVAPNASAPSCPPETALLPGGRFHSGMPDRGTSQEEYPRIEVELAPFCLDLRETTLAEYRACVARGACTPPSEKGRFCNARLAGREQHPVNCVTWDQAQAYCQAAGRRLPDELEWEYAARGGQEYRRYPWGSEHPDGRTCWKHPGGSCAVGSYPAGAFGLFDVSGNVWEWTRDRFGPYPFPPPDGTVRSYRGGSWSRRFEKWMRPGLRNRDRQSAQGSHLGFRCALTPPGVSCPAGADPEGGCLRAVLGAECEPGFSWNGARCSRRGAAGCPSGMSERRGYGCVPDHVVSGPLPPGEERPITSARTPAFDGDCAAHYPGRPAAYRWEGGTHATRNHRSRARGCANRDVGTGWNSTCCP